MKKLILFLLLSIPYLAISQTAVINSGGVRVVGTTANQVLTWNGTTWVASTNPISSLTVASANGFSGILSGGTTPVITLGTTVTGMLKGNGTAMSVATAGTDYENPLTFSSGLTRTTNNISNNLITGLTGSQTVIGGTAASETLTLSSTSNATKGKINFGSFSTYNESNDRLGINILNPASTLHVNQQAIAIATGGSGTNANTLLTIVGVKGGSSSFSGSFVQGGNAGLITITGGNGGDITGTPTTGIGGAGAAINIIAGNGGQGNTNGGAGGNVTLQPGDAGISLGGTLGAPGWLKLFAGNASVIGNGSGASVFIGGGAKNGTGSDGNIYMQVTPSFNVRSSGVKIGGISAPVALLTLGEKGTRVGTFSQATAATSAVGQGTITFTPSNTTFADFTLTWPADDGTTNQVLTTDGSGILSWTTPSGGSGITSLGGQTGTTQTFANGTAGLTPAFSSTSNVHTLNIPLASTASVTAGLLSNTDYLLFATKVAKSSNGVINKVARWTSTTEIGPGSISDFGDGATIQATANNAILDATSIAAISLQTDEMQLVIDNATNDAVFTDTRTVTKGMEYAADYRTGYTSRSWPDVQWVEDQIAAITTASPAASFITRTTEASLSNETALTSLGTDGLLWNTVATGTLSTATTTNLGSVFGGATTQTLYYNGASLAPTSTIVTNNSTVGIGVAQIAGAMLRVGGNLRTDGGIQIQGVGNSVATTGSNLELLNTNTSNIWSLLNDNSNLLTLGYKVGAGAVTSMMTMSSTGATSFTGLVSVPTGGTLGTKIRVTSLASGVALADNITRVILDPASSVANFTLTLPANPYDGQVVYIQFGGNGVAVNTALVTGTFTVAAGAGETMYQSTAPTTVNSGATFAYIFESVTAKWWRLIL